MSEHIRAAFTRQRRNLMAVSLVLIFVEFVDLTITKVNLFGNELTVSNPMAVNYALWIGYVYWLWRYYVYFHELGDKKLFSAYREQMLGLVKRNAFHQLKRDPIIIKQAQDRKVELDSAAPTPHSAFRYVVNVSVKFLPPTEQINAQPESVSRLGIEVTAFVPLMISHTCAWVYVLTRTHPPSEYLLPYLVAAVPVVYKAIRALTAV